MNSISKIIHPVVQAASKLASKHGEDKYAEAFQAGFDACQVRYLDILQRVPLHCQAFRERLPLHPCQPDELLEHNDWMQAQGAPKHGN